MFIDKDGGVDGDVVGKGWLERGDGVEWESAPIGLSVAVIDVIFFNGGVIVVDVLEVDGFDLPHVWTEEFFEGIDVGFCE